MGLVFPFALGVIVGITLVVLFVLSENKRFAARRHLAASTAAFSKLNVDDVRRIFTKHAFPQWILFTEYQKVSWLNNELRKMWPYVDKATSDLTGAVMEPILEQYKPPVISSIKFQKFTLGTVAPQFIGIRNVETSEEEIVMELEAQWDGNPNIVLAVKTVLGVSLPVQVKDVAVTGVFRVVLKPLVDVMPCFGAVMYSLREQKKLDFKLKVIGGDIKAFPMIASAVDGMIRTAVTDSFLWPMRQVIPILPGDYSDLEMRSRGKLEVKLVQARDLLNMDIFGKSDPFAELFIRPIRSRMKKSRTIDNDLNPVWNENFEFEVEDPQTQNLTIHVFDEDNVQASERIGSAQIQLNELQPGTLTELWLPLVKDIRNTSEQKYRGQVQVELLYSPFDDDAWFNIPIKLTSKKSSTIDRRPLSFNLSSRSFLKNANFHYTISPRQRSQEQSGVLSVNVVRAENLPAKDLNGQSDPFVILRMKRSNQRKKTKVIFKTRNPEWNEKFDFVVDDAFHDLLQLEVWDHDFFRKDFMGSCAMTLSKVLNEGSCTEVQQLGPKTAAGRLHLRLEWKPRA